VYVDVPSSLASIGSLASPDATPVSSSCVRRTLTGCPRGGAPFPEGSGARPCRLSSALGDASRVVRPSALLGSSYRVLQRPPLRRRPAWCPLPHTASDVLRHDDATRHTRSVLVVSHHLDGLLRFRARIYCNAMPNRVHCVSPLNLLLSKAETSPTGDSRIPTAQLTPLKEFHSPAAFCVSTAFTFLTFTLAQSLYHFPLISFLLNSRMNTLIPKNERPQTVPTRCSSEEAHRPDEAI